MEIENDVDGYSDITKRCFLRKQLKPKALCRLVEMKNIIPSTMLFLLLLIGRNEALACRFLVQTPTEHNPLEIVLSGTVVDYIELTPVNDFRLLLEGASLNYSVPDFANPLNAVLVEVDTIISSPFGPLERVLVLPFNYRGDCSLFLPTLEKLEYEYPKSQKVQIVGLSYVDSTLFLIPNQSVIYCYLGHNTKMTLSGFDPQYEIRRFLKMLSESKSTAKKQQIIRKNAESDCCSNSALRSIIQNYIRNPFKKWLLLKQYK